MLTFLDKFPYQRLHLARLGMPPGLMLGVNKPAIDRHLERPVRGWDEGNLLDPRLERLQQFGCQTGSLFGIVSNRAVFNGDVHGWLLVNDAMIITYCLSIKSIFI
jgi:hypothetical protein